VNADAGFIISSNRSTFDFLHGSSWDFVKAVMMIVHLCAAYAPPKALHTVIGSCQMEIKNKTADIR